MRTTVYISRHSQPFRKLLGEYNSKEIEQLRNEKNILSVEGEIKAKKLCDIDELKTVNPVVSICTQIGNWLKSLNFQAKLTPTSA